MYKSILTTVILIPLSISQSAFADGIKVQNTTYDQENKQLIIKGKIDGYGDSAIIEIKDAANPELIIGQQYTDKQFKSHIPVEQLPYIPCTLSFTVNGDETNTIYRDIKHAPENCGKFSTTISGLITDEPIPYATVSVTLDGITYTTTADQYGAYSLEILTANIEQLLIIESTAEDAETGDEINFVNMVGSFSKILEGDTEQNVTNVSTASYILAVEANGGTEPTTIEELEAAETSIDATELFELAAVIKLIVDDPNYSLPSGYDSVIEFISDETAVETFVTNTPEAAINDALANILSDTNLVSGFTFNEIPELYYSISVTNPGYLSRSGSAIEFNKVNNSGTSLGFSGWNGHAVNEEFTWSLIDGRIELTYTTPDTYDMLTDNIEQLTDDQAEIDAFLNGGGVDDLIVTSEKTISKTYTRVVDGELVDVISVETRIERTTPPITLKDGSTLTLAKPMLIIESSNNTFRSSLDITPIPFVTECTINSACVLGDWGAMYHYPAGTRVYDDYVYPNSSYADLITFYSDLTSTGAISGKPSAWVVDNEGKLVITYEDGMVQTSQILDNLGIEYGVFSTFENGNDKFATYDIWVKGSNFTLDTDFLSPSTPDHYWNGEVNSWIPGSFDDNNMLINNRLFGWLFTESTTVSNVTGSDVGWAAPDENGLSTLDFNVRASVPYAIDNNIVEIERFPWAKRYWYPVASTTVNGDRIFYVVEREDRDNGDGYKTFIPARMNIQREVDRNQYIDVAR